MLVWGLGFGAHASVELGFALYRAGGRELTFDRSETKRSIRQCFTEWAHEALHPNPETPKPLNPTPKTRQAPKP